MEAGFKFTNIKVYIIILMKCKSSVYEDYGEIEKMFEQITDHVENDPGNKIVD